MRDLNIEFRLQNWQVVALAVIIFLLGVLLGAKVSAQEDHPAFGQRQEIVLTVTADVPDIAKLEARAVEVLRRTDFGGFTLEEARAKVRVDGKTDVARCIEYLTIYQLQQISQAHITGVRQAVQHPEPVSP